MGKTKATHPNAQYIMTIPSSVLPYFFTNDWRKLYNQSSSTSFLMSEAGDNGDVEASHSDQVYEVIEALRESKYDLIQIMIQDKPKILIQNVREYGFFRDDSLVEVLIKQFKIINEPEDDDYYNDCDDGYHDEAYFPPSWSTAEWKVQDHEKKKKEQHPDTEKIAQTIKIAQ